MQITQTSLINCAKDRFLRADPKYHYSISKGLMNLFSTPEMENIRLSDILEENYHICPYIEGLKYKGIPTGRAYIDEDGYIIDWQNVTDDDHPGRLKYSVSSENILISSLKLAKSPALLFENIDLENYVFSNGFYIFKVKNGWNKKFVLYLLRSSKIKKLLDTNIYRGIGISAYRCDDLLKCEVKNAPVNEQDASMQRIIPIEKRIADLKPSIKPAQMIIDDIFDGIKNLFSTCYVLPRLRSCLIPTYIAELAFQHIDVMIC